MAELYFVRHGQASFGTTDYDRLSALGAQQARWLGEYFAEREISFDRIIIGSMLRHRQSASAILGALPAAPAVREDPDLDEYDFAALFASLGDEHDDLRALARGGQRDYYRGLKRVLGLWIDDQLGDRVPERWSAFAQRIAAARRRLQAGGGRRVLVVSSGGPMACFAQQVLEAPDRTAIELNMQLRNSAFCRYYFNAASCTLAGYNELPHLDRPERREAITYG